LKKDSSLESIFNIQSGKSCDHLGKATKTDHKYRKPWEPSGRNHMGMFLPERRVYLCWDWICSVQLTETKTQMYINLVWWFL